MSDSFGSRLLAARKRRKWTQEVLAEKTDVSRRMVVAYESNETPPNYKFIAALLLLGFDLGYLISGVETGTQAQAQAQELSPLQKAIQIIDSTTIDPGSTVSILSRDELALVSSYRQASPSMKKVISDLAKVALSQAA